VLFLREIDERKGLEAVPMKRSEFLMGWKDMMGRSGQEFVFEQNVRG
jgi:hypothetical protein